MIKACNVALPTLVRTVLRTEDNRRTRPLTRQLEDYGFSNQMPLFFVPTLDDTEIMRQIYGPLQVRDISQFDGEGLVVRIIWLEDEELDPAYAYVELEETDEDTRLLGYLIYPEHQRDFLVALQNFPDLAPLVSPVPRTIDGLKKALRQLGMVARSEFGEIRVTFKMGTHRQDRAEAVASYCSMDTREAYATALDMFTRRARNGGKI